MATSIVSRRPARSSPPAIQSPAAPQKEAIELLAEIHSILMLVVAALQDYENGGADRRGVLDGSTQVHNGEAARATRSAMTKVNRVWSLFSDGVDGVDDLGHLPGSRDMEGAMIEAYGLLLLAANAMPSNLDDENVGVPEQCAVRVAARLVKETHDRLAHAATDYQRKRAA